MTRIVVDPRRPLGSVDRNVFGGFVEHLGRCIYGGLYDEGSRLADSRGFRSDVLDLLRELRMGVLRWPGGNFVSNYHWADGTGPRYRRPRRPDGTRGKCRVGVLPYAAHDAVRMPLGLRSWLSIRGDEAEGSWRVVTPVLTAWSKDVVPLHEYLAGSAGPRPNRSRPGRG